MTRSVRTLVAFIGATVLLVAFAAQTLAHPPPPHLHCLTTPSGDVHPIARGVTLHAPHEPAFHSFHEHAHLGGFGAHHPLAPLAPDFTEPFTCPPSP